MAQNASFFPKTAIGHALLEAIGRRERGLLPCPMEKHRRLSELYRWEDIALRTERVYAGVVDEPEPETGWALIRHRMRK